MTFRLTTRPGHPTFADLPWEVPLQEWESGRIVTPVKGISRHVVRFVAYGPDMYAIKELPDRLAEREHQMLRGLSARNVPVVETIGLALGRRRPEGDELDGVLITHHLPFSLPYRALFAQSSLRDLFSPLLDSLVGLLVRIHLAGFFWGDCSLNNTLFRRDAGALAAYLVDAETGELHDQLSNGQRGFDLDIAEENVAGGLLDLQAAGDLSADIDPAEVGADLRARYDRLWAELTEDKVVPVADQLQVDARVRRINELGFDVDELELMPRDDGWHLRLTTHVVEPGHHRRRLMSLVGLDVQENQARRLLNDVGVYRCNIEAQTGNVLAEQVAALRWMVEVFEPTIALVPAELRAKLEPAELYHQILEHRWFLSEESSVDVGLEAAVADYVATVLPALPDEKQVVSVGEATGELPVVPSLPPVAR